MPGRPGEVTLSAGGETKVLCHYQQEWGYESFWLSSAELVDYGSSFVILCKCIAREAGRYARNALVILQVDSTTIETRNIRVVRARDEWVGVIFDKDKISPGQFSNHVHPGGIPPPPPETWVRANYRLAYVESKDGRPRLQTFLGDAVELPAPVARLLDGQSFRAAEREADDGKIVLHDNKIDRTPRVRMTVSGKLVPLESRTYLVMTLGGELVSRFAVRDADIRWESWGYAIRRCWFEGPRTIVEHTVHEYGRGEVSRLALGGQSWLPGLRYSPLSATFYDDRRGAAVATHRAGALAQERASVARAQEHLQALEPGPQDDGDDGDNGDEGEPMPLRVLRCFLAEELDGLVYLAAVVAANKNPASAWVLHGGDWEVVQGERPEEE